MVGGSVIGGVFIGAGAAVTCGEAVAVGSWVGRAVVTGSAARVVGVVTAVTAVTVSPSLGIQAPKRNKALMSINER
jgi:hypothetical protein